MDFSTWFATWFATHPLNVFSKEPPEAYTTEVMRRVRALEDAPASRLVRRWWAGLVPLSAGLVTVAVAIVAALCLAQRSQPQMAGSVPAGRALVRVADSSGSDESWLEETTQLLDELDEAAPDGTNDADVSDEDYLHELETLDQASPS